MRADLEGVAELRLWQLPGRLPCITYAHVSSPPPVGLAYECSDAQSLSDSICWHSGNETSRAPGDWS